MSSDAFDKYLSEINKAYLRGDATEHTHRPVPDFVGFTGYASGQFGPNRPGRPILEKRMA